MSSTQVRTEADAAMMRHYVIVYDRLDGLLELRAFTTHEDAFELRREREKTAAPDTEVVILNAPNLAQVLRTHGRYFS